MSYNNAKHHKLGRFYILVERTFDHVRSIIPNFNDEHPEIPAPTEMFYIKIGITTQKETATSGVRKRLSSNQVGNPRQLEYAFLSLPFENFIDYENKIKKLLEHSHVRGEWYWVNEYEFSDLMDMVSEDTDIISDKLYYEDCIHTYYQVKQGIIGEEYTPSTDEIMDTFFEREEIYD